MDYFSTFNRLAEKSLGFSTESFASQGAGILLTINQGDSCPSNSSPVGSSGTRCRCDEGYQVNANGDGCEAIPPPPPPPTYTYFCKTYSASDLDTWVIDESMWDNQTSQNVHNGAVRATVFDCYHWTLDSSTASDLNTALNNSIASSGDIVGVIFYEIPYTECGGTSTHKTWLQRNILLKRAADGTYTQFSGSSINYFQQMLIGTNDSRYDWATIHSSGRYLSSLYPALRITNAQRSSIISSIVSYYDSVFGTHETDVGTDYDDCFMLNQSPPRWVTDESGGNRGIEWREAAQECKCGAIEALKVSIVFEVLQIGNQPSTSGRFTAITNCYRNWSDHTSEISPDSNGNYDKASLLSELEDLKTRSRNYLANCDREKIQDTEEFRERMREESRCDLGYQKGNASCPENSYKQLSGGGVAFLKGWDTQCWRCVCTEGYVSSNYEQDTDSYIVPLDGVCTEKSCMENAFYDASLDSCVCLSGYEKNEDGTLCNPKNLTPIDGECTEHSTLGDDGNCYCNAGYIADGGKCVATSTNGDETWDIESHLKEYGMWYGLGFLGFVALKAFGGKGE
tara:strand:- start:3690 stop:5393 length:1704 start_codon:yes stop_codon:yes gene_type:complete